MTLGIILVTIYVLGLLFIYRRSEKKLFSGKNNWIINGISLFAVNSTFSTALVYSGLFFTKGISSLWIFWSYIIFSGIIPFVFAPLWAKLNFITDNQFILFRFSGIGAKILHAFRAGYVGFLVVSLLISLKLVALIQICSFLFPISKEVLMLLIFCAILVLSFRNNFLSNQNFDILNGTILFSIMAISSFIFMEHDVPKTINYSSAFPTELSLIPLLFFHNFSTTLFDGSGTDAQRYFNTKENGNAWKTAVLYTVLSSLFSLFIIGILIKMEIPTSDNQELFIINQLLEKLPQWLIPILLLAIIGSFLSSIQGFINWGGSFITKDLFNTYLRPNSDIKQLKKIGRISMITICLVSCLIAFYSENLISIIIVFFSLSAGVAPVFILRWFWMRINAWSQLSAMIASAVYTISYLIFLKNGELENNIIQFTNWSQYYVQLIIISIFTVITWLIVSFSTPQTADHVIIRFKTTLELSKVSLFKSAKRALFFGVVMFVFFCSGLYFWIEIV